MVAPPDPTPTLALAWDAAVSALAALVFARAGALKLRAWSSLAGVVDNYDVLPSFMSPVVAAALPILEIALAAALGVSALSSMLRPAPWGPWALASAAALLLVFALAMAINLARGRGHIECGCGDARARQPLRAGLVIRNLAMAGALIVGALTSQMMREAALPRAPDLTGGLVGLVGGGVAFLLYLCHESFVALPRRVRSARLPPPDPRLGFAVRQRAGGAR